ncbi:FliI/YscN family ATPase [Roseomonas elaeocarpi]|uniref:FliI/YscN family ATPase n=1 Tax=Roseomonas elaeocarpi TaxID=907779 RepID=A0ABV6JTI5_9PROT
MNDLVELAGSVNQAAEKIDKVQLTVCMGRVASVVGTGVEVAGLHPPPPVGHRLLVVSQEPESSRAEIVGASGGRLLASLHGAAQGIAPGQPVRVLDAATLSPDRSWLGRVIDPTGRPMDGLGPLRDGPRARAIRAAPPQAGQRARLGPRLDLGVRALDIFATCRRGQRLGLFAASGVGKSTLMSMLARGADTEVTVICLVGERGRELREFIEDDLGPEGLRRAVVVCATSDASPLMRRDAALAAMTVAEHFRDEGQQVLLLMDSVTRFAMALREIGLAAGEPPTTKGYPPSVFAELPRLLERAGTAAEGAGGGAITGLFTVLVEGDDHDEPVADAVRGILDGHVVLDRAIGEGGRYPAVDVLRSLSRTSPGCLLPEERPILLRARRILALFRDMADLVRLGAYRAGTDPAVDEAVRLAPRIEAVLTQRKDEREGVAEAFRQLAIALEAA